ncbi:MAG: hypothetical protein OXT67_01585 [Zetaproteobacteria bacterium]|nr:hypothetical protein [Zetaproteobacteria bacterium]
MKRSYIAFILMMLHSTLWAHQKRIIILSTDSGGGHTTAQRTLETTLKNLKYRVEVKYPNKQNDVASMFEHGWDYLYSHGYFEIIELWKKSKPVLDLTLGATSYLLQIAGPAFHAIGIHFHPENKTETEKFILDITNADLVISVIPSWNDIFFGATKITSTPFRIVPTDLDISDFMNGIINPQSHPNFQMWVANDMPEIRNQCKKIGFICQEIGYPVHAHFTEKGRMLRSIAKEEYQATLRQKYHVKPETLIISLMMGAKGFEKDIFILYVSSLAAILNEFGQYKSRLEVFCGKNQALAQEVQRISQGYTNTNVTIRTHGFTPSEQVAEWLAISDAFLTKPGGATANEAMAIGVPTLFLRNPITHENTNADILEAHGWSRSFKPLSRKKALHPTELTHITQQIWQHSMQPISQHPIPKPHIPEFIQHLGLQSRVLWHNPLTQPIYTAWEKLLENKDIIDPPSLRNLLHQTIFTPLPLPPQNTFHERICQEVEYALIPS